MFVRFPTVEGVRMNLVHLHQKCRHFSSAVVVHQVTEVVENSEIEVAGR